MITFQLAEATHRVLINLYIHIYIILKCQWLLIKNIP